MKFLASHESSTRGTFDFPIELYYVDKMHPRYEMPFHWHMEFELMLVLSGEFSLLIDGRSYLLHKGDAAIISAGAVHGGTPSDCVYECVVFDMNRFLGSGSVCQAKYNALFERGAQIEPYQPAGSVTCQLIDRLFEAMEKEPEGYEFVTIGLMWQLGWVAANDGNVSVRLEDGTFLATPTGMSKSFITPDKLLRIDAKGNVLEGAEGLRPSSEIKMHLRCYEKRADVNAVVHAHPPAATGFAVAHRPMDMYNMIEDVAAIGAVPLTPYGTPSTTEVPDAIEPYLNDHDVMLLENHGALTVGSDVITAYYRMESLELWAKITINAIILGGSYDIDRKNIDKLINLRSYYKITGKHPGYRKFERREKGEPTDK